MSNIPVIVALTNEIADLHKALQATAGRDGENDNLWLEAVRNASRKLTSACQDLTSATYR